MAEGPKCRFLPSLCENHDQPLPLVTAQYRRSRKITALRSRDQRERSMREVRVVIRNLAVGLAASGACVFLCALLLGQQQGTQRLGELQEEADRASTGCVACHGQTDS